MGLRETDVECAAVATAPRVSLADIEAAIAGRYDVSGAEALIPCRLVNADDLERLRVLSICILVLHNGWTVIGKSAPASAENFNAELGRKLAYEDCIRQLWPLMGFALKERLATPTVGRIVWFYPGDGARSRMNALADQPFRADIVYVSSDRRVSLNVDDHMGVRHFVPATILLQDGDKAPEGISYATWMPHQVAVAKGEIAPVHHAAGSATIATSGTELDSH